MALINRSPRDINARSLEEWQLRLVVLNSTPGAARFLRLHLNSDGVQVGQERGTAGACIVSETSTQSDKRFGQGEFHAERAAYTRSAFNLDRAAHRLRQTSGEDESNTGAFNSGALCPETFERGEQPGKLRLGKARTGVTDLQSQTVTLRIKHGLKRGPDFPVGTVELDGV